MMKYLRLIHVNGNYWNSEPADYTEEEAKEAQDLLNKAASGTLDSLSFLTMGGGWWCFPTKQIAALGLVDMTPDELIQYNATNQKGKNANRN
jgi:hypothetical protein